MCEFKLTDVTHGQYTGAKYRHSFFAGKRSLRLKASDYLMMQSVRLMLKELHDFVLFGADVDLRQYLIVVGIEIELMSEGEGFFVLFDIFFEELI